MAFSSGTATSPRPGTTGWLLAAALALGSVIIYWPATGHSFVNYDDPLYVTKNLHVQSGLTWKGLAWAFGNIHGEETYWHPLTWMSHMLDCQLYGLKPWGHHLTNVLLHGVNVGLLFLVLRALFAAPARCALMALIFAFHPLQVDTVAWIAERKNLLATLFWLLSTWAYIAYAKRPQSSPSRITHHASRLYFTALLLFALGLLCKPVLVTLPCVLLLLDYWPLRRLTTFALTSPNPALRRVLLEKLPFLLLAAASCVVTLLSHQALGGLESATRFPFALRAANTLVSYAGYLEHFFWPAGLSVFYPYPTNWPIGEVLGCGVVLALLSVLVIRGARRWPALLVGWLWFLGVLVPFIGLVQAGEQAMADRFMYVPIIGLALAVVWGVGQLCNGRAGQRFRASAALAGVLVVALCVVLTRHQLQYWQEGEALFRHALRVTENNWLAHNNLGNELQRRGRSDEAIAQYEQVLRLRPTNIDAHNNLGTTLCLQGKGDQGIRHFEQALALKPSSAGTHNNLAVALYQQGRVPEAIFHFREAVRLKPDYADAQRNLARVLAASQSAAPAARP